MTLPAFAPNFLAGPTGLDPYRPWSVAILDGMFYLANGFDNPRRWDLGTNFYYLGATAPTTFALALSSAGTPAAIPTGQTPMYYLVFFNSTTGKETAPQLTSGVAGVSIANATGATRDVTVTWADPGGEFDKARIYRRLNGTALFVLVATVTAATAIYLDVTPDSGLLTNTAYVPTYRVDLPPIFLGLQAYQQRLFAWKRDIAFLYYAQTVRTDSRSVSEDFPAANILPVGSNDGLGSITAMLPYYGAAAIFKWRGCYEMTGVDPSTFALRPLSKDRGAFNPRCILQLDSQALILDERGVYWWTPAGVAEVFGAKPGQSESPMQPYIDRMNLSAAELFHVTHDRARGLAIFWIALDYEPVPNVGLVCDHRNNKFVGVDTERWSTAAGHLDDALGYAHRMRGDEFMLWEEDQTAAEGPTAGSVTGTLTAATANSASAAAASFGANALTGATGCPVRFYTSGGAYIETGRVATATTNVLTLVNFTTATLAVGNTVSVGTIPGVAQTADIAIPGGNKFGMQAIVVEHDSGVSGNLNVKTAPNGGTLVAKTAIDLTSRVRTQIPVKDRGFTETIQFWQDQPNLGFSIRGVTLRFVPVIGART